MRTRENLAFLLASIGKQKISGILSINWGGMFKSFLIKKGKICDLLSNRPEESLEELLRTEFEVPEDFLARALEARKTPVEFLVEKGLLTLSETHRGNRKRVVEALRDVLEWLEPEISFQEWEVNCELPPVDLLEALKEAITSMKDRRFFKRLFPLGARLVTASFPGKPTEREKKLLREFAGGRDVWEVVRKSPWGEFPTLKLISILYIFGFLKPYIAEESLEEIEEYRKTSNLNPYEEESSFGRKVLLISLLLVILAGAVFFLYLKLSSSGPETQQKTGETQRVIENPPESPRKVSQKTGSSGEKKTVKKTSTALPPQGPWKYVKAGKLKRAALLWRDWARSTRGYTVLKQLNCVEEYALLNLKRGGRMYFAVPYRKGNRMCYRICYGVFPSKEEAQKASRGKGVPYPLSAL